MATGATTKLFDAIWEPGRPCWSPDGKTIALAAFRPQSARFRDGLSEILTIDVATGQGRYQPILPNKSLGVRGDDGPVLSPDGASMAFVFASRLHLAPVDASGWLIGPPKALNAEVTDAVSWSGDGKQLLYLSNGELRLIDVAGGPPTTAPHRLTWAAAKGAGRLVVRAGRLWTGLSPELRRNVEVVIEGAYWRHRSGGPRPARRRQNGGCLRQHRHSRPGRHACASPDGRLRVRRPGRPPVAVARCHQCPLTGLARLPHGRGS